MLKPLLYVATLGLLLTLTGCATMFGDNSRSVSVNSNPSGAQVYLNGQPIGQTPTTVTLAKVTGNYIEIDKKGYQSIIQPIPTKYQPVGFLNILFLPGFIVDYAADNMFTPASNTFSFNLDAISSDK